MMNRKRLFDRFFPEFDLEAEKRIMDKAYEDVEDDLDDNFCHATLRAHLGKEILDNAESECVKAACRGEMALVDVLNDEIERQKRIGAEIEKRSGFRSSGNAGVSSHSGRHRRRRTAARMGCGSKRFDVGRSRKSGVVKVRRTV